MTKIVYDVIDSEGVMHEVTTKSEAELLTANGGSINMRYIEQPSSDEAYCKAITRCPGSRT